LSRQADHGAHAVAARTRGRADGSGRIDPVVAQAGRGLSHWPDTKAGDGEFRSRIAAAATRVGALSPASTGGSSDTAGSAIGRDHRARRHASLPKVTP
jgi:hypothetical protein